MTNVRLTFEPAWNWPVLLVVLCVGVVVLYLGYRLTAGITPQRKFTLLGLRMLALAILFLSLARPQLQWISENDSRSEVWVLVDNSRSMGVEDGTAGRTRAVMLEQLLSQTEPEWKQLAEEVTLKWFLFDEQLQEWQPDQPEQLTQTGEQTSIADGLKSPLQAVKQNQLVSTFLLTDGAQRALPPRDDDPREVALKLGEAGVSLYPVPIGQVASSQSGFDFAIDEIQVDPVVFEKKRVPVRVKVRWSGAAGRNMKIRLLLEDRLGKRAEESGELKQLPLLEQARTSADLATRYPDGSEVVELNFTPEISGEYKLAVQIEPEEGEVLQQNNLRQTLITVRQGGLRVAYFDIFRTEVKSVRQLNDSEKIQVDFQLMRSGKFRAENTIDPLWFDPGRYDVYIIGDVSAAQMGAGTLELLAARIRDGAGLLMLGGYHTYGAGGYAASPLEPFVPVKMHPSEQIADDAIDSRQQILGELQLRPTSAGQRHYVTRIESAAQNQAAWSALPAMTGATRIQAKSDFVEVLATSTTGDDLMVAAETGRSRVMCLAFDQTWLWFQAGFAESHRRFWRQMIFWLAHKELDTDQQVWLAIQPKATDPGGRVQFEFGARNEQGNPLSDVEYRFRLTKPDGTISDLTGGDVAAGGFLSFDRTELPGDYFVQLEAYQNGNSIGFPAQARFIVNDRDLELDNPIVDLSLLQELALQAGYATDSQVVNPEELQQFLQKYLKNRPWVQQQEVTSRLNLWDGWPLLLAFTFVISMEWYLRKQEGLV